MTDTLLWATLLLAGVALIFAILAHRNSTEALRIARSAGGASLALPATKADRKAAEILTQRAEALLAKVNALPPVMLGPGADAKVREGPLWVGAEVASLRETTPALAATIAEALESVEPGMTWLLERVTAIRATAKGSGVYLIDFPHDGWRRNHQEVLAGLQEIVARGKARK